MLTGCVAASTMTANTGLNESKGSLQTYTRPTADRILTTWSEIQRLKYFMKKMKIKAKFWISTHKHNDWYDLRRVGREFSDPLKLFLLFFLSVFTNYYSVLTSNILSFHFLGRPGGMNPVCFFRSTIRRSIFSSRSMIRTTDTSMVGSRRTVTMDRCSTIHNCLASSSDSPWTWKRRESEGFLRGFCTTTRVEPGRVFNHRIFFVWLNKGLKKKERKEWTQV